LFNENLGLKLFSVLMAVFIWLQSLLVSEQHGVVNLPVSLKAIPKNITLNSLPKKIPFNVRGKGLEIIKLKLSKTKVSLDASKMKPGVDIISLSDYSVDLPENIHVTLVGPVEKQEIAVQADVFNQKKVPVELSFADNISRQRFASLNYQLIPDKLVIFGPRSRIQLIDHLITEEITRQQLSEREFTLKVPEPDKDVSLAENRVKVRISSSFNTSKVFDGLAIQTPAGTSSFPTRVALKVSGDSDALKLLDPLSIKVGVAPEADASGMHQVIVEVPTGMQVVAITPAKVKLK